MSDTPDVFNSLPAIMLLWFWWVFLTMAELLSRQCEAERMKTQAHHPAGEIEGEGDRAIFPEASGARSHLRLSRVLEGCAQGV